MRSVAILIFVCLFASSACAEAAQPAASPGRCKGVYKPPICAGVNRICEIDDDGCESCTCDSQAPLAPGAAER